MREVYPARPLTKDRPLLSAPPSFNIDSLGVGKATRSLNNQQLTSHRLSKAHTVYCNKAGSSRQSLELYFPLGTNAANFSTKKLGMSGYIVSISENEQNVDEAFLCIKANPRNHRKVKAFRLLVAYIVDELCRDASQERTIDRVVYLLKEYRRLHSVNAHEGMSEHELVGLYGELFVMKNILMPVFENWERVFDMWKGYKKEKQDFADSNWVLEVKANRSIDAKLIWINGLRQLETVPGKGLFLCHLFFDSASDGGDVITRLIDDIDQDLPSHNLRMQFKSALRDVGYDESLAMEWDTLKFTTPEISFYDVLKKDTPHIFPRITKADAEEWIVDFKYKLMRDGLLPFYIKQDEFVDYICSSSAAKQSKERKLVAFVRHRSLPTPLPSRRRL